MKSKHTFFKTSHLELVQYMWIFFWVQSKGSLVEKSSFFSVQIFTVSSFYMLDMCKRNHFLFKSICCYLQYYSLHHVFFASSDWDIFNIKFRMHPFLEQPLDVVVLNIHKCSDYTNVSGLGFRHKYWFWKVHYCKTL